jgi:hypothetical protein
MLAASVPSLAPEVFARLRKIVRERAGIHLGDHKRQLCQTRLARRLRALDLASFEAYLVELGRPGSTEHVELVNAITTNVTAFFREPHHFELLASTVPALVAVPARTRLRLWSAGCSSGEEPWSMGMVLDKARLPARWDVKIKALIQDSADKVGQGARLVHQSGDALREIVTSVKKVSGDHCGERGAGERDRADRAGPPLGRRSSRGPAPRASRLRRRLMRDPRSSTGSLPHLRTGSCCALSRSERGRCAHQVHDDRHCLMPRPRRVRVC